MMLAATFMTLLLPALTLAAPTQPTRREHDKPDLIDSGVFEFTSTYIAHATPDTIVNGSQVSVPGLPDGYGTFKFGILVEEELICWNIAVYISGDYFSAANTATHIHEAPWGRSGPPRLAFPNPTSDAPIDEFGRRTSYGCMKGPFETGIVVDGVDTGANFSLAEIEANPPAFFADTHTVEYAAGAIRGQLDLDQTSY